MAAGGGAEGLLWDCQVAAAAAAPERMFAAQDLPCAGALLVPMHECGDAGAEAVG